MDALLAAHTRVDFRRHVWPLLAKEICWGYYQELFTGHPERTTWPWDVFAERYAEWPGESDASTTWWPRPCPPRTTASTSTASTARSRASASPTDDELQDHLPRTSRPTSPAAADPAYSADLGAFMALLSSFRQLARVVASGQLGARSRVDEMDGWWFGFFSFLASGPPPDRLEQLLALSRAGVVRFLGGGAVVPGRRRRPGVPWPVAQRPGGGGGQPALIEARLPRPTWRAPAMSGALLVVARARDVRGARCSTTTTAPAISTGRLMVSAEHLRTARSQRAAPSSAVRPWCSHQPVGGGSVLPAPHQRPAFRQHDAAARAILQQLAELERPTSSAGRARDWAG